MSIPVKLSNIIDGMETQSDESSSYLNKKTGEIVLIGFEEMSAAEDNDPIEDFPEWQQELVETAREIAADSDVYIALPSKFDINEYDIMEKFCLSLKNAEMQEFLYHKIKGSGAFRRFKEAIYQNEIQEDWFAFRNSALKEIAVEWCQENDIEFDEA